MVGEIFKTGRIGEIIWKIEDMRIVQNMQKAGYLEGYVAICNITDQFS